MVEPVNPVPPHCPHLATVDTPPVGEAMTVIRVVLIVQAVFVAEAEVTGVVWALVVEVALLEEAAGAEVAVALLVVTITFEVMIVVFEVVTVAFEVVVETAAFEVVVPPLEAPFQTFGPGIV